MGTRRKSQLYGVITVLTALCACGNSQMMMNPSMYGGQMGAMNPMMMQSPYMMNPYMYQQMQGMQGGMQPMTWDPSMFAGTQQMQTPQTPATQTQQPTDSTQSSQTPSTSASSTPITTQDTTGATLVNFARDAPAQNATETAAQPVAAAVSASPASSPSAAAGDGVAGRTIGGEEAPTKNSTISKSELFSFPGIHPTTMGALKGSSRLTRFQIWWLVGQSIAKVSERQRPDYIFLWPHPFQQGIPAMNISQALLSPLPRPEVIKSLIQEAPGMLPSQLAVISQRIRLNDPSILRSIISSSNPSVLLNKFNPRIVRANIRSIIRTIMEMPETGRFGITSVHAKLLPLNMLTAWLQSVNVTSWTAKDLLGQSPLGSANELQLALPGVTCREIKNLKSPVDVVYVADAYRAELYNLRSVQDVIYPTRLRRCFLEEIIEYLITKPATNGHVLDGLTTPEIRAIGGEILTGIPSAALKLASPTVQVAIIHEISKLEPITLATFASLNKLQYYADTLFSGINVVEDTNGPDPFLQGFQPQGRIVAESADNTDTPSTQGSQDATQGTQTLAPPAEGVAGATAVPLPVDQPANANVTAPIRVRRADPDVAADRLGGLFCYSNLLLKGNPNRDAMRAFLEEKESIGEKTCCMDPIMRGSWSKFLKAVLGNDIKQWTEFDLLAAGDLLVSLSPEEIATISLEALSKVVTSLIKQTGFHLPLQVPGKIESSNFGAVCTKMMGRSEGLEYLAAQKAYMKRLAQAAQWMLSSPESRTPVNTAADLKLTCEGLSIAGQAATGYTAEDIMKMDPKDMFDCLETIGLLDFDDATKATLLQYFKDTFHLTSKQLSIYVLLELGNFVPALKPEDALEMPLGLPRATDSLSVLGLQVKNVDTLKAIASKFIADNRFLPGVLGISRSPDLRVVMRSLGNVICRINENTLASIFDSDPTLLIEVSPDLGRVEGCSFSTLAVFANSAIRPANYGPPEAWSQEDVRTLGVVVAGLQPDMISRIPPVSMEGLTPLAMKSLPTQSLLSLSPAQIRSIPPDSAAMLDLTQSNLMNPDQKDALKATVAIISDGFVLESKITSMGTAKMFAGFVGGDFLTPKTETPPAPAAVAPSLEGRSSPDAAVQPEVPIVADNSTLLYNATATPVVNGTLLSDVNGTTANNATLEGELTARSIDSLNGTSVLNGTILANGTETVHPTTHINGTDPESTIVVSVTEDNSTAHSAGDMGLPPPASSAFTFVPSILALYCLVFSLSNLFAF